MKDKQIVTNEFVKKRNVYDFGLHTEFAKTYMHDIAQVIFDTKIDSKYTQKLMYEASHTSNKKELSELRNELSTHFDELYHYMQTQGIRQFHFHLPDAVSFLRFHKPKKFGDSLVGIRPTVEYVNKHHRQVTAFEEGRIFNGFRNVYPIFYNGEFVGSVEISSSFAAIQEIMQRTQKASLLFMISSDIVSQKVFNSEQSHYVKSEFCGFMFDKQVLSNQPELTLEQLHIINEAIASEAKKYIDTEKSFSLCFRSDKVFNNKSISIDFLPVFNLQGKKVAYIINYEIDEVLDLLSAKNKTLIVILSILSFVLSLILSLIYRYFKTREASIHEMATHDALTKIYNRYGLQEVLEQKVGEFKRYKRDLSVIFFDIDHFKQVNDTYGHSAGDEVLKKLSNLIAQNIRTSDIFARWGGEEFILVLPETSLFDAVILAEKLRKKIEEYDFEKPPHLTCSFGVTDMNEHEDEKEMLRRVDEFLYRAKELGRNRIVSDIET